MQIPPNPPATPMNGAGSSPWKPQQAVTGGATTTTTVAGTLRPAHTLSPLESLPEELRLQVFSHLHDPHDLAAVSATSKVLRHSIKVPLDSSALVASITHAADPLAELEKALPKIRLITPLAHAVAPLRAAALSLLRLPASERGGWQVELCAAVAGLGFAPALKARLQAFINAVAAITACPAQADRGLAAFQTLLNESRGLSDATQDRLVAALARAFWSGALGDQGFSARRDPRVLPMFRQLLAAVETWPETRAISVLAPLLLGMRSLYAGDLGPALAAALPLVERLGPQNRPLALESLRRGLMTIGEGMDYRTLKIEALLAETPVEAQQRAVGWVRAQIESLLLESRH